MAANAVFISVLTYLIPLWSNTEGYLIRALQVVQNKAARCVTRQSWYTSTRQILRQCGWLSIRQLGFYHSILTMHRILRNDKPVYLRSRVAFDFPYQTRLATGGNIRCSRENVMEGSFTSKSIVNYNRIPDSLKTVTSLPTLKRKLKKWSTENIPIN